ncbi:MAG: heavy metal-binding domain-containing protein [Deltaproteobacteria bacterium]|nr:heavy metal-binding domain-containing protein [Deltaproteobacteria bacterium]
MLEAIFGNLDLSLFLLLIVVGYACGTIAEKRHYKSIIKREKELIKLMVVNAEGRFADGTVRESFLVSGSTVISNDYFKRLLAILRNIFGGRVTAYESLIDRSRRESILRMKEKAHARGAHMIVNLRLETSTIGRSANQKNSIGSVETLAYGTAVVMNRP